MAASRTDETASRTDDAEVKPTASYDEGQVQRNTALMSALVIISRITGFFRTWGQAFALGVTVTSSCYTVANGLPNQLYELVIGGMLTTAFLPVYLSVKQRLGRDASNDYASNLLSLVTILMGTLCILGFVFAGQVIWTQSFNANADFDVDLSIYFFRFFVIEVVLYALSSLFSGMLNAERDYLWSNAAPIFNNFVCTASFFAYAALANTNPSLALLCLAVGNPLGVAVQVLLQVPSLRRHGIRLRFYVNLHDPAIKETLSIGIPTLVATIVSFATNSVSTSCQLRVTVAGASVAYYARLWYTLPYAILAVPITVAMFTELSDLVSHDDTPGFVHGLTRGTSQVMFFLVPCALLLITFSEPLVTLLAASRFSADEIQITARYLSVLAVALPLYGISTYLQKVFSALRRMRLYMVAAVVASIAQIVYCLAFTDTLGLDAVSSSTFLCFLIVDVMSYASLRRSLGPIGLRSIAWGMLRSLLLGAAASAVGFGVMALLTRLIGPMGQSAVRAAVFTFAGGIPAVIAFVGLAVAVRAPESAMFTTIVNRLLKRG